MDMNLHKKRALVCGSSQGIGKASAIELCKLGADITLMARSIDALEKTLEELKKISKGKHELIVADFSRPDEVKEKIEKYLQKEKIQILINNTGGPAPGPALNASLEDFQKGITMHLFCNQILVQATVPGMKESGYGRIINIVSTSVRQPIPNLGVSNTVRAAIAGWAKTLSNELGPLGITVNNILPGFTDTARLKSLMEERAKREGKNYADLIKNLEEQIPLRRLAKAEEIASAVAFLASPAAGYITGQSLMVDGGRTGVI
jgi:3-oxoacyl-[acyl-carrier protein] reductase